MKTSTLRNTISIALFAVATSTTGLAQARQAAADTPATNRASMADFQLPAGKLAAALGAFGTQSGLRLEYPPALVANKQAKAVQGHMGWREALDRLLQGSGLAYRQVSDTTIVIVRSQGNAGSEDHAVPAHSITPASPAAPKVTELSTVTVTGTRIRGGTTASPVIVIGSEQIQQEGFANLGQVIRSIPQNFSGGQNPGVYASANVSGNNYNTTGGSGLNLRGLGPDATLTLLNGRRMSYTGASQAVDISAIPVEAVERLEIVPDGASAIYGSDAVGGVVNVILKRDFEGVTVGAHYGVAADGGLATRGYNVTAGTVWATGGLIVAGIITSSDPIYSDQRDYTASMYRPSTLWQRNDLRSGLLSLHQSLGRSVELRLDALRSERSIMTDTAYSRVYYHNTPETKTALVSPSLEWYLANDWLLTVSAAFGKDKTYTHQQVINIETGAISTNSIGTYDNKSIIYEIGVEGRVLTLPGGDVRLAAGIGYRYNEFVALGISSRTTIADGDESSRFGYAELSMPLIGPGQEIHGLERLALTAAIRTENYKTYGRVTTPKFGLIYSPDANFTLKTSWGKSFKAPKFLQRFSDQYVLYYPSTAFGATGYPIDATVLYRTGGGGKRLRPERARTWSTSLAFHPESLPGLEAELTWFDIDYTDRIVQPVVPTQALANPIYAKFVDYFPTGEALEKAVDSSDSFYNYVGSPYDASKVVAIVDGRYVNAARQKINGFDLSGSYRSDLGMGRLTIRGSASWLDSTQATISTQTPYDLAGTLFNPARFSGRVGVIWQQGIVTASVFGNYRSGVRNTADVTEGASYTTFDTTLIYDTGDGGGLFASVTFELAVRNLFNRAPPLYAVALLSAAPYDSTNYSAVGRFLSLSVSKHW